MEPVRHEIEPDRPMLAEESGWPAARPKFRGSRAVHTGLFLLTVLTTTFVGAGHYAGFASEFVYEPATIDGAFFLRGLWYSLTILLILGCHEMGHYLACRFYNVDASLPYFIPVPFLLTGTAGAFIRIREPIPTKWMLFDIGIAGPIAGFLVAVPALIWGLSMSSVAAIPPDFQGQELGEPLLFQAVEYVLWGVPPSGYDVNLHPVGFAAWFGLLATALNLFPVGQLDGGHICYAVLGRRSSRITILTVGVMIVLTYFSLSWLVWTMLMMVMLLMFGPHHPRTIDEDVPLDRTRLVLAGVALAIFAVCFTPAPIEPLNLIGSGR